MKQNSESFGTFDLYGHVWADTVIVTYGRIFSEAAKAAKILLKNNIKVKILKLNRIKPIDEAAVEAVLGAKHIYFYEEGVRSGGIAEKFAATLLLKGYKGTYDITAIEDCFVKQAKVPDLIKEYKLDCDSIVEKISNNKLR